MKSSKNNTNKKSMQCNNSREEELKYLLYRLPEMFMKERNIELPQEEECELLYVMNDEELVGHYACFLVSTIRNLAFEPGEMDKLHEAYFIHRIEQRNLN